jgi:hypothetical protein
MKITRNILLDNYRRISYIPGVADVAELADAQASGACGGNPMEVRFLSSALKKN